MTACDLVVDILLVLGVTVELLSCLGLLLMRNALDRLHYLGPATTLGPLLLGAAVLVQHSSLQACVKAVLIVLTLLTISAVLTPATGKAAHVRQEARSSSSSSPSDAGP